jgi:hypothetical protein
VVEHAVQLVDRVGPEGVAHLGPVEGHPHHAGVDRPVVGDVGQLEAGDGVPGIGIEQG